jgi:hypothetical protein
MPKLESNNSNVGALQLFFSLQATAGPALNNNPTMALSKQTEYSHYDFQIGLVSIRRRSMGPQASADTPSQETENSLRFWEICPTSNQAVSSGG